MLEVISTTSKMWRKVEQELQESRKVSPQLLEDGTEVPIPSSPKVGSKLEVEEAVTDLLTPRNGGTRTTHARLGSTNANTRIRVTVMKKPNRNGKGNPNRPILITWK